MKEKKSIQIRSGKDVCETFRMQGLWKKRDCYQDLEYFMKDNSANTYGKICALYGLRRSGKTVMMEQCISAMPEEEQEKCFYLLCRRNSEADVDTLYDCLDGLMEQGAKYIFIDEITYLHGFQAAANELSDYYGKMAKIVIAGTDSLGIRFAMSDSLYDRVYPIHTTRVPYAEWARILKGKTIDDYIRYGGLLTVEPYRDKQHRDEYLNTSITDNVMHSMMEGHEGRKYFRALSDLYDEELLKSLINKMINRFSYNVVLSAVQSDYKNVPLHTTVNNMGRRLYKKKLNLDEVTERTKTALGILNEDETERKLQQDDLLELKNYLAALDLFARIPTFSSLEKYQKSLDTEVLTQPGMVYAHATVLADALAQDEAWKEECLEEEKTQFRFRAENEVRGRILENVVLSETYLAIGAKEMSQYFYVSQLTVRGMESGLERDYEADLIVVDFQHRKTCLFEIKYSMEKVENQGKNLQNAEFLSYVTKNFAPVELTAVIYRGKSGSLELSNGAAQKYINAGEFLSTIHEIGLGVKNGELSPEKLDFAEVIMRERGGSGEISIGADSIAAWNRRILRRS